MRRKIPRPIRGIAAIEIVAQRPPHTAERVAQFDQGIEALLGVAGPGDGFHPARLATDATGADAAGGADQIVRLATGGGEIPALNQFVDRIDAVGDRDLVVAEQGAELGSDAVLQRIDRLIIDRFHRRLGGGHRHARRGGCQGGADLAKLG